MHCAGERDMTVASDRPRHAQSRPFAPYALRDVVLDDLPCVHDEGPVLPGPLLLDDAWLGERIADTCRRWRHDDPRVAATLWWYSASATLAGPGADALLRGVDAPDPCPANLRLTLRLSGHTGYLARTCSRDLVSGGPAGYGAAAAAGLAPVVAALARLGGANPRALWSVYADSLAGRLLAYAGTTRQRCDLTALTALTALAAEVLTGAGGVFPVPRYAVATRAATSAATSAGVSAGAGADGGAGVGVGRIFVRRGSCCLIYAVPGHGKCENCPRQRPADRAARVLARG